jgi:hypothetical protein
MVEIWKFLVLNLFGVFCRLEGNVIIFENNYFGWFVYMVFLYSRGQVSFEFIISVVLILAFFVFSLMIFEQRTGLNISYSETWFAQGMAYKLARNINNAYLLDDNSFLSEDLYWVDGGQSVSLGRKSIQVFFNNSFGEAPLSTSNVDWRISDVNGLIYFKKVGGRVIVDYS